MLEIRPENPKCLSASLLNFSSQELDPRTWDMRDVSINMARETVEVIVAPTIGSPIFSRPSFLKFVEIAKRTAAVNGKIKSFLFHSRMFPSCEVRKFIPINMSRAPAARYGVSFSFNRKTAMSIDKNVLEPTMGEVKTTPRREMPMSLKRAAMPGAIMPARTK